MEGITKNGIMDFPYQKNDTSPLYEAFPMIMLTLANGDVIRLNFFMKYWEQFAPTRYIEDGGKGFIPTVKYHTKFVTPHDVIIYFINLVEEEMKTSGSRLIKASSKSFIRWDAVCKIEVEMQYYIVAFDKIEWNDKLPIVIEEPRLVTDLSEIEHEHKTEHLDFRFLEKGREMFKNCI